MTGADASPSARDNFRNRLLSGMVLAIAAIAVTLAGSLAFAAFWGAAAAVAAAEWVSLFAAQRRGTAVVFAAVAMVAAVGLAEGGLFLWALAALAFGMAILASAAGPAASLGLPYAAPIAIGPLLLHKDPVLGVAAIFWLFAVVWGTDVAAYFGGRAIGGAKLWPSVSPKKTWSGAIVGAVFGTAASVAVAAMFGLRSFVALVLVGLVLSIVTQAGDLFESAIKRRVGVKDSGHIIPGHGGVMDRLDGFTAAACVAVGIGVARGGTEAAAQGLLQW